MSSSNSNSDSLSQAQKDLIIDASKSPDVTLEEMADAFQTTPSVISDIIKSQHSIKRSDTKVKNDLAKNANVEDTEKRLYEWVCEQKEGKLPLDGSIIKTQAKIIHGCVDKYKFNHVWLTSFLAKFDIEMEITEDSSVSIWPEGSEESESDLDDDRYQKPRKTPLKKSLEPQRKHLSLQEKLAVIEASKTAIFDPVDIAKMFSTTLKSVKRILKNQLKIKQFADQQISIDSKKVMRQSKYQETEKKLYEWYCQQVEDGSPITGSFVIAKAKEIHGDNPDFKFSPGWLHKFKQRHNIKFRNKDQSTEEPTLKVDLEPDFELASELSYTDSESDQNYENESDGDYEKYLERNAVEVSIKSETQSDDGAIFSKIKVEQLNIDIIPVADPDEPVSDPDFEPELSRNTKIASNGIKSQRKRLSLSDKLSIIDASKEPSFDRKTTAQKYGISKSMISRLLKEEDSLEKLRDSHISMANKKTIRYGKIQDTEDELYEWFSEQKRNGKKVSGLMIKEQAKKIHGETEEIKFSAGWLHKFQERFGIKLRDKKSQTKGDTNDDLASKLALPDLSEIEKDMPFDLPDLNHFPSKRKHLSLQEKVDIIKRSKEQNFNRQEIGAEYGISQSSIANILKNQETILKFIDSTHSIQSKKNMRQGDAYETEKKLYEWICQQREQGFPISGPIIRAHAMKIHCACCDFKFSVGWLDRFKDRFGIKLEPRRKKTKEPSKSKTQQPESNIPLLDPNLMDLSKSRMKDAMNFELQSQLHYQMNPHIHPDFHSHIYSQIHPQFQSTMPSALNTAIHVPPSDNLQEKSETSLKSRLYPSNDSTNDVNNIQSSHQSTKKTELNHVKEEMVHDTKSKNSTSQSIGSKKSSNEKVVNLTDRESPQKKKKGKPKIVSDPKRKHLSLQDKLRMIEASKSPLFKQGDIAEMFGTSKSVVSRTLQQAKTILSFANGSVAIKAKKNIRISKVNDIEKKLYVWIHQLEKNGYPVNGPIIKAQAKKIQGENCEFKFSEGWLHKFKERYGIKFKNGKLIEIPKEELNVDFEEVTPAEEDSIFSPDIKLEYHIEEETTFKSEIEEEIETKLEPLLDQEVVDESDHCVKEEVNDDYDNELDPNPSFNIEEGFEGEDNTFDHEQSPDIGPGDNNEFEDLEQEAYEAFDEDFEPAPKRKKVLKSKKVPETKEEPQFDVNNPYFCNETGLFYDKMPRKKVSRKHLNLEEKIQLIKASKEPSFSRKEIAKKYKISQSAIARILKDQDILLNYTNEKTSLETKKNMRKGDVHETEKKLYEWICEQKEKGNPISGPIIRAYAKEIHCACCDFKFSVGWLDRFKHRFGIKLEARRKQTNNGTTTKESWIGKSFS